MCTIIVLNEAYPGYPLIVAANRDERYDRKSSPPDVQAGLIAPRDDVRGGTWIGVARGGWFVGLTNQDDGRHDDTRLSRGQVVADVLRAGNHTAAAQALARLDPDRYNPFNLVFGRPGAMFLTRVRAGRKVEMQPIPEGVHAFSNDCWDHHYDEKTEWAARMARSLTLDPPISSVAEVTSRLFVTLGSHFAHRQAKDDPFQSVCVHADEFAFGTVSSSVITVSNQGVVEYWFKEGHACQPTGLTLVGRLEPDE